MFVSNLLVGFSVGTHGPFLKREITWKWSKIMRKICLALDMLILCTECALFGIGCAFFRESANWHGFLVFAIGSLLRHQSLDTNTWLILDINTWPTNPWPTNTWPTNTWPTIDRSGFFYLKLESIRFQIESGPSSSRMSDRVYPPITNIFVYIFDLLPSLENAVLFFINIIPIPDTPTLN